MGQSLKAECKDCNFNAQVSYGGGMMNFKYNCPAPAIEKTTGEFKIVNHKDKSLHDYYDFYTDDTLKHKGYIGRTHDNFDLKLNFNSNFCPQCHGFTLSFIRTAIYIQHMIKLKVLIL